MDKENEAEKGEGQDLDQVAAARIDELKQIIHRNAEQHKETIKTVRRNYHGMVQLLIEVISLGNRYLGGHLKRCAETTWHFCTHMQIPKDICYLHYYGALLHDIGLVGREAALSEVPPEQLSDQQREEYVQHPIYGQHIISAVYNLKRTAAIIRAHHERYDGHGFPDKLGGASIPFGARVVRVTNDWDNLLYKYSLKVDEASQSMSSGAGTLYDPKIIESFLAFAPDWIKNREQSGKRIRLADLEPGMYLKDDILLSNGLMLVPHGMILDQSTIEKIHSFQSMIEGDHTVTVV
jgi:response regulator RpfG family c-di-GMP phosphodiesterase